MRHWAFLEWQQYASVGKGAKTWTLSWPSILMSLSFPVARFRSIGDVNTVLKLVVVLCWLHDPNQLNGKSCFVLFFAHITSWWCGAHNSTWRQSHINWPKQILNSTKITDLGYFLTVHQRHTAQQASQFLGFTVSSPSTLNTRSLKRHKQTIHLLQESQKTQDTQPVRMCRCQLATQLTSVFIQQKLLSLTPARQWWRVRCFRRVYWCWAVIFRTHLQ